MAYTPAQIVLVVVVIVLAVLVLFYWLGREPDRPSEATAAAAAVTQSVSHVVDSCWVLGSLGHRVIRS